MAASKTDIRNWLKIGKREKATHVIVVCDTFDWEDYPVYVSPEEDVHEVEAKFRGNMQKVMEVYSMALDLEKQLKEPRAFHYD